MSELHIKQRRLPVSVDDGLLIIRAALGMLVRNGEQPRIEVFGAEAP